jgi:hypothetical protein
LIKAAAVVVFVFVAAASLQGQTLPDIKLSRTSVPPRIDGELGDTLWESPPLSLGEWVSYNPFRGERSAPKTDVWMAYDDRYIYVAFHCFDSEPDRIRSTISKRDNVFNDDWVGLSLDSAAAGQTAYHLFVNPSGIQMDALNTSASGEQMDADFVWDSAGKITTDGYVVEIRLPLQTIRFKGGTNVRMGILFYRHISRSGMSYSWPDMPPGMWVFNRHAHLVFDDLHQPRLVELLPSVTVPVNQTRAAPGRWNAATSAGNVGLSGKLGVTSNITVDATVNPDFSQVESDAFQVQENQRFPIFYSEKRPFFMEGMGLFNVAGTGGDSNMRTAVHTRRIVDPAWGAKVTGISGRTAFGVLSASDSTPEDIGNRGAEVAGATKLSTLGRVTYGLGGSDYVGGLVADTEHAGRHNRVAGGDLSMRLSRTQNVSATFLTTQTGIRSGDQQHGSAEQFSYGYNTRRLTVSTQVEHYDRDFQMDTAFYNRTGFTTGWLYSELNFYPKANRLGVVNVFPFIFAKYGHDHVQRGNEEAANTGIRFHFRRQGFLSLSYIRGYEPWLGYRYEVGHGINSFGRVQLFRWLNINGNFSQGQQVFYDPVDPFQGRSSNASFGITLQPNQHINQYLQYNGVQFERSSTGERVFTVHILNSRSTYQFDKHFLVRLIEQFDSSRHQLLTDLLASYELVPGTVFHAGYGSIYEKATFDDGVAVPNTGTYLTISRGLFFKISYLHRF